MTNTTLTNTHSRKGWLPLRRRKKTRLRTESHYMISRPLTLGKASLDGNLRGDPISGMPIICMQALKIKLSKTVRSKAKNFDQRLRPQQAEQANSIQAQQPVAQKLRPLTTINWTKIQGSTLARNTSDPSGHPWLADLNLIRNTPTAMLTCVEVSPTNSSQTLKLLEEINQLK